MDSACRAFPASAPCCLHRAAHLRDGSVSLPVHHSERNALHMPWTIFVGKKDIQDKCEYKYTCNIQNPPLTPSCIECALLQFPLHATSIAPQAFI